MFMCEGGDNAVDSAPTTVHEALKAIRQTIPTVGAPSSERQTLDDLEWIFNPYIQGWIDYQRTNDMTITQKKQLITLLTFACALAGTTLLAGSNVLLAAAFSLTKYTVSPLALNFPAIQGAPANNNEIPPAIIKDKSNNYFVSGYMSFSCLGNWGLFDSGIHAFAGCSKVLGPVVDNIQTGYITESMADALPAYKRNFNGIFSVVEYNNPASSNGLSLLAVMHEENKGEAKPYAGGGVGSFRNSVSRSITNLVNGDTGPTSFNKTTECYSAFFPAPPIPNPGNPGMGIIRNGPITVPSYGHL